MKKMNIALLLLTSLFAQSSYSTDWIEHGHTGIICSHQSGKISVYKTEAEGIAEVTFFKKDSEVSNQFLAKYEFAESADELVYTISVSSQKKMQIFFKDQQDWVASRAFLIHKNRSGLQKEFLTCEVSD